MGATPTARKTRLRLLLGTRRLGATWRPPTRPAFTSPPPVLLRRRCKRPPPRTTSRTAKQHPSKGARPRTARFAARTVQHILILARGVPCPSRYANPNHLANGKE